jgi:hypothetical protein
MTTVDQVAAALNRFQQVATEEGFEPRDLILMKIGLELERANDLAAKHTHDMYGALSNISDQIFTAS